MKKKCIFLLFLSVTNFLISQDKIESFILDLKQTNSEIRDVFPVVNQENGNFVLFVSDAKNVYAYKFDTNFKVVSKITSEKKQRNFSDFLGYSASKNGDFHLFMKEKNFERNFLRITFSFESNTTKLTKFSLNNVLGDAKERFVKAFPYQDKFYIVSSLVNSKIFFLREVYNDEIVVHNIGEGIQNFVSRKGKKISIGKLINRNKYNISIIDEQLPNTVEIVGEPIKIYKTEDSLLFSFDGNSKKTQILKVNLKDFKEEYLSFLKPMQNLTRRKKTNSFLYKNKLLLMTSIFEGIQIDIVDFKTAAKEKDFKIFRNKKIGFKNSPIIQKGGFIGNYREIEGTKNFIRKMNASKVGIALRKSSEGQFQMTIGGYIQQTSTGVVPMYGFGAIGGFVIAINQTQFAFNSYNSTKSIQIECLLNANFNHIEGDVSKNVFDKVNDYQDSFKLDLEQKDNYGNYNSSKAVKKRGSGTSVPNFTSNANILFKYEDYFVKIFYDKSKKEFTFRKFTE